MPLHGTSVIFRSSFTHLEVHSHFTLLGATASVEQLVQRASADGLTHLALTDNNALYGAISFDKACQTAGIQPILGMTVSTAFDHDDLLVSTASPPNNGRLLLLATGPAGYRSLCRLSTHLQGQPDRNTLGIKGLGWAELRANAGGLICLTGGRQGALYRFLQAGNQAAASRYVAHLGGIFDERAYLALELQQAGDADIAREILALGQRFGLPPVPLQPVYYLEKGSGSKLQLLQAIDRNCPLEEVSQGSGGYHWLSPSEMMARFAEFPEALEQIGQITGRCQAALPDGRPIWPVLKLSQEQAPEDVLATAAENGLLAHYGPDVPAPVRERLQVELTAIKRSGYAPLFLIVADITRFARHNEIPVSTRGSVANSLVAFCSGITTVDPIANDLLFERFLNPARANPPDIDLDFCSRRRDEVLAYVRRTYGPDQVALVATINTLQPKSAVRLTAKAFGLAEKEISQLA
jgi:DNA polymerase-3 subunit alpha